MGAGEIPVALNMPFHGRHVKNERDIRHMWFWVVLFSLLGLSSITRASGA